MSTLDSLAQEAIHAVLGQARRFDTEAGEAIITNVETQLRGTIEASFEGQTIRVHARPIETLLVGDAIFVRRIKGGERGSYLYDHFSRRGDLDDTDPLAYQPRIRTTLQILLPIDLPRIVGTLGADYPCRCVEWTLMACEGDTGSITVEILEGSAAFNVRPVLVSMTGTTPPALAGQNYLQQVVGVDWFRAVGDQPRFQFRVTAVSGFLYPVTLMLVLERL